MSKKKTHEEYVEQVKKTNPSIVVVERYIDAKTPIKHICACGELWVAKPTNVLSGRLCNKCKGVRSSVSQRQNLGDYIAKLSEVNNKVTCVASEYINAQTKISHQCLICGAIFLMKPNKALAGQGHRECSLKENGANARILPKVYVERIREINPNIELLSDYEKSDSPIDAKCLVCGNTWTVKQAYQLYVSGCPKCADVRVGDFQRMSHNEFLSRVNPNIEILSTYNGYNSLIDCRCTVCGHQRTVTASSLLSHTKYGCPKCGGNYKYSHEEYVELFNDRVSDIELLGEYAGASEPIQCKCKRCGLIWEAPKAHNLLIGVGCPMCAVSHGERQIAEWLNKNGISYVHGKEFFDLKGIKGGHLSYDFYLVKQNVLIEFQGEQHEHPIEGVFWGGAKGFLVQYEHDRRKRNYAKDHNIRLIEIWYYDANNIAEILDKELNSETVETVTAI